MRRRKKWKRALPRRGHEHGVKSVEMQGVRRLSAREEAQILQGVRWSLSLRARPSALYRKECGGCNLRARSYSLSCKDCGGSQIREHAVAL